MMAMMMSDPGVSRYTSIEEDRKNAERKRRRNAELIKETNGMKRFVFGGIEIWAINEKNAIRKAKKRHLI